MTSEYACEGLWLNIKNRAHRPGLSQSENSGKLHRRSDPVAEFNAAYLITAWRCANKRGMPPGNMENVYSGAPAPVKTRREEISPSSPQFDRRRKLTRATSPNTSMRGYKP